MLREIPSTRQNTDEPPRRWFTSHEFDLFVWAFSNQRVVKFQLTYDKDRTEKALTWDVEEGFTHDKIHDQKAAQHPSSPVLITEAKPDISTIKEQFDVASTGIDEEIRQFVLRRIEEYPRPERLQVGVEAQEPKTSRLPIAALSYFIAGVLALVALVAAISRI